MRGSRHDVHRPRADAPVNDRLQMADHSLGEGGRHTRDRKQFRRESSISQLAAVPNQFALLEEADLQTAWRYRVLSVGIWVCPCGR